jgi:hypothetical protein
LLLTAQISKYIEEAQADLSIIIRGGKPLEFYRDSFTIPVYIYPTRMNFRINSH